MKYGGWRTLVPEDADGRANLRQVRNAIQDMYQARNDRDLWGGMGMEPAPWQGGGGIDGLRKSQEWGRMVDAKIKKIGKKNDLIDRAERGDEDAIKELNNMAAREKNMMLLRKQYPLPKQAKMIQGIRKGRR